MAGEPIVNVDQAQAWDGEEGEHWAAHAERYDAAIREHRALVLDGAQITTHDAVLDVGCGSGATTRGAARAAVDGRVLGVDLSRAMLARGRATADAEGLTNIELVHGDAQVFPFEPSTFDVAISRFGVMFFSDPVAAFANIRRALRPGGRVAFVVWRAIADNEWFSEIARALTAGREVPQPGAGTPGPFGLHDADFVRDVFTRAGFSAVAVDAKDAKYHAGAGVDDAFDNLSRLGFSRRILQDLDDTATATALDALRATIAAHATDHDVVFDSSAWLITATNS